MKKMTEKQKAAAALKAHNDAKVFATEVIGGAERVYRVYAATECYPEGRQVFVAEIAPNYGGKGLPLCIYLPEPDPVIAWQGNGIMLGTFAADRAEAMTKIRELYSN